MKFLRNPHENGTVRDTQPDSEEESVAVDGRHVLGTITSVLVGWIRWSETANAHAGTGFVRSCDDWTPSAPLSQRLNTPTLLAVQNTQQQFVVNQSKRQRKQSDGKKNKNM